MSGVYDILLKTTIISSGMIVVILAIKRIMANKLSLRWHYTIWFLLVIRLMLPISVPSSLSIYNLLGTYERSSTIQEPVTYEMDSSLITEDKVSPNALITRDTQPQSENPNMGGKDQKHHIEKPRWEIHQIDVKAISVILWLVGLILIGSITLLHNCHIRYKIARSVPIEEHNMMTVLEACKEKLGITKKVHMKWVTGISSPAITGMLSPTILLPISYRENLPDGLEIIILHELLHYKRRDVILLRLLTILQVIYWFNPLVWIAFYKMRQEMEMCCDESVLKIIGIQHKAAYGKLILNLIERNVSAPLSLPALLGGHKAMKARLSQLMKHHKRTKYTIGLGIVIICLVMVFFMTDKQDTTKQEEGNTIATSHSEDGEINENQDLTINSLEEDKTVADIGGTDGPTVMFTGEKIKDVRLDEADVQELQILTNGEHYKTITDLETINRLARNLIFEIGIRSDMAAKEFLDTISLAHGRNQPITLIIDKIYNQKVDKIIVKMESGDLSANYTLANNNVMVSNIIDIPMDTFDYHLPKDVKALVDKYSLNVGYYLLNTKLILPESFDYYVGDNPIPLYWAYKNELIKDINMDITDYLGKEIELIWYTLDDMPEVKTSKYYLRPNRLTILRYDGKIIGAYIGSNVSQRACYSLKGSTLEQMTKMAFNPWVDQFVVMTEETNALAKLTPKEVVEAYYAALEKKDFKKANQLVTISTLFDIGSYIGDYKLHGFFHQNMESLSLIRINETNVSTNGIYRFDIDLDVQYKENRLGEWTISSQNVKKEQKQVGYKVDAIVGAFDIATPNE
ncbi:DUF4830 domain-containing protein [Vallitalea pronyensis]|uniref:DUF4830 domain-containing protein n=1 Tax=Vallitalea pronyensis TaxID=1348613 RepID=A0A8J8SI97_9FIRM|nr:M56 family metallopeptidase [Vallitalea pronyensis]QUI24268.1 DUF4830 domain-containing protein [Vallitalea pronyensis]